MEYRFDVDKILIDEICLVDHSLVLKGWRSTTKNRVEYQQLYEIIDTIGEASSFAQGLNRVITSADKLQNSDQLLYLMKEKEKDRTVVVGMLKIGRKKLFLLDHAKNTKEVAPLCVLDFYIHESRQRRGYGKKLFDHMLKDQNIYPGHMAVDKPSDKFMFFLKKHYGLVKEVPQINNFVVFETFFQDRSVSEEESSMTQVNRGSNRGSRRSSAHSSRAASREGSLSPAGSRKGSISGHSHYAGKPTHREANILYSTYNELDAHKTYMDHLYTSDILHGRIDRTPVNTRIAPRQQTTLSWMRGSDSETRSPYARTPSYQGSPSRSGYATPPSYSPKDVSSQKTAKVENENHVQMVEVSIAPTPSVSPNRKTEEEKDRQAGEESSSINGVQEDEQLQESLDKLEEMSVTDRGYETPSSKTGGWRDSISRNSEGLVDHMSTKKGSTMTGVLSDQESVHGHLKFHHHALW